MLALCDQMSSSSLSAPSFPVSRDFSFESENDCVGFAGDNAGLGERAEVSADTRATLFTAEEDGAILSGGTKSHGRLIFL